MAILFTITVFVRNLLRRSRRINIFHIFVLMSKLRFELGPYYLLDYADFNTCIHGLKNESKTCDLTFPCSSNALKELLST